MEPNKRRDAIKTCIIVAIIVIIVAVAITINVRYSVEGEKNMPFILSKINIVSTAEGVQNEQAEEKWNMNIYQNNDVYFSIEKNAEYTDEAKIQSVAIENIVVTTAPAKGNVRIYMPNSSEGRTFTYAQEYLITDGKLEYKGATKSNTQTLEVGNQGGTIVIRFCNSDFGTYISNDDAEIKHDGTLISKTDATLEELQFEVTFDLIVKTKDLSYKTSISLSLPCGNIIEEGHSSTEITDTEKFVFKRI